MRHVVTPAQCRALGLPEVSFAVSVHGMMASSRADAYLAGSGAPGGVLWFEVASARAQGVGALEPSLRARLGPEPVSVALSNAPIAGALRPCIVATAGTGIARTAAFAALVVDPRWCPQGLVVMAACGASADAVPSLQAVLARSELRLLVEGLVLGEGAAAVAPQAPAPEAIAWIDLDGPGGVTRHPLAGARTVLGRSQAADVLVYDPKVSRQHAMIERRVGGYTLRIIPSANGVSVGGTLYAEGEFPLADGDAFSLGDTVARLGVAPGRGPTPIGQRDARVDAYFARLGLPSPPIPMGVYVAPTAEGVATPPSGGGPRLAITLRGGDGLAGFSYEWASRAWTISLQGKSFGASRDVGAVRATFLALAAVLADAMQYEGTLAPPGAVRCVAVRASDPAGAYWTSVFGDEYVSACALDALLESLAWRRASRL